MSITISYEQFLPTDIIHITTSHLFDASYEYGKKTRSLTQKALRDKIHNPKYKIRYNEVNNILQRAQHHIHERLFVVDNVNVLARYLVMLRGFAKGSGISLIDTVFLQSFADSSCQTLFSKDNKLQAINVVHIEENQEDKHLVLLHKLLEKNQKQGTRASLFSDTIRMQHLYHYRLTKWQTSDVTYEFFAYPGIVGPGSTFSINHRTQTIIMTDTLNPALDNLDCSLWSNAIAYMIADIGDVEKVKHFYDLLIKRKLSIFGGYAIHLVQYNAPYKYFFCEFRGNQMTINRPMYSDTRVTLAQTNYPRSQMLRKTDLYNMPATCSLEDKQAGLMVKRRTKQLSHIVKQSLHPTANTKQDIRKLRKLITSPEGDIEYFENGPVLAGFSNPYSASYLLGSFGVEGGEICIGKLLPPPRKKNKYQLFFTKNRQMMHKHKDLLGLTIDSLISRKLPLHVAVLYSTPTQKTIASGYAASDEDTAYVAGKVAKALRSKNVHTSLVPLKESTIDDIDRLKTDCVFNLVEWTGLDIPLSKKVFSHLRTLHIPVTGATEKNYYETSDKIIAKRLFEKNQIPTPQSQAFYSGRETISTALQFPVIVKPSLEHGSVGLGKDAIARNASELISVLQRQILKHKQPVLAEAFIRGRELMIYLLELHGKLRMLPIQEITFTSHDPLTFQTYESKWIKSHIDYASTRVRSPRLKASERILIEKVSRRTFEKLGFRGYARLDIRFKDSIPYVLEANSNPNVYDSDDDQIPGIAFVEYIWAIVVAALKAYKNGWKI